MSPSCGTHFPLFHPHNLPSKPCIEMLFLIEMGGRQHVHADRVNHNMCILEASELKIFVTFTCGSVEMTIL